jgi:predicted ATPase
MPELDTITIKGFKSIASIEKLKLGAINVVIGPNGSGKSNFIGVFALIKELRAGRLQDYAGKIGVGNLLHFGPKVTDALQLELVFHGDGGRVYSVSLEPGMVTDLVPLKETATHDGTGETDYSGPEDNGPVWSVAEKMQRRGNEAGLSDDETLGPVSRWIAAQVDGWMICHFHDTSEFSNMRLPCAVDDNRRLRADGSNLPAFLHLLKQKHPTAYSLIRRTVQRVAPFFDDFVLEPSKLNPDKIKLEWKHREQDQYFDAWALSDGTLRFIALATLFLQPKELRPPLILVDEPELGLHPYAINLLGSMVKVAAVDSQVILATQSPLLLDEFSPEDVLVAERDGHATTFRRLNAASLETWLEDYSLGELWEKNELGGRPKAWLG